MKIAYPNLLFDRNIIDGRAMMCSVLTLTIGNNQALTSHSALCLPRFIQQHVVHVYNMWEG